MSRNALKAIVKECLVEILNEGLGNVQFVSQAPRVTEQRQRQVSRPRPAYDPALDTRSGLHTDALKSAIKEGSGGNPMLAEMLADTAVTTLPEQLKHGDRAGRQQEGTGMPVSAAPALSQQEQFKGNPDEIFTGAASPGADGTSYWADLAFAPAAKKLA